MSLEKKLQAEQAGQTTAFKEVLLYKELHER